LAVRESALAKNSDQVISLGFSMIETYIPWSVHETSPGHYDWGQEDERKDVEASMELCEAKGLWLMVRPGPLINADRVYQGVRQSSSCAQHVAMGVFDRGRIEIVLILEIRAGMIDRVTTFEALDLKQDSLQVSSKFLENVWHQLGQKFPTLAAVLLCTPSVFEAWINGENKRLVLQLAITAITTALAIRKDIDPTGLSGYASPKEA
jgi:hypothetical protein